MTGHYKDSDRISGPFERAETWSERLSGYLPATRHEVRDLWDFVVAEVTTTATALTDIANSLTQIRSVMSADRDLLATIAEGLTTLSAPVAALIASEAALRARVADLEGEAAADEAGDLAAAQGVKTAFDALAAQLTGEPSAPDVEPLPTPEPTPEPAPELEPAPEGEQPV